MVLHFPAKYTEEEEALQLKFAKLRRKRKQLQEVNKPKQEPEQNKLKRPAEAKDAKEVAKKLLKTGAIKAIQKSLNKEKSMTNTPLPCAKYKSTISLTRLTLIQSLHMWMTMKRR